LKNIYLYFSTGNAQPSEPALCQLYRRTFVPYNAAAAYTFFSAGNARAVSVQLAFFTTRKQWLGFLAELRVNQTPDVAVWT